MNRREALAALISLPAISRISVAELKPNDVLVVECDGELSQSQQSNITASLSQIWPDRKIAIFQKGLRLKALG